ncbi:MAG: crotonase/enoyl-CoA hydratase family protein [Deltaproteobacteria bacterium]|nr:crotonase/enoyl-CoA hydratase family protein [Deltaproteobacteria bacterium]
MDFNTIIYEIEDRIATVTLNRPDRLNAWTVEMMDELIEAFDMADKDDEVRVIIVTGAGRGFCAGADLGGGPRPKGKTTEQSSGVPRDTAGQFTLKVFENTKPVIAAINGPAVGVGTTMVLPMDIRIASDQARMGLVFNRRGMVPEGACTWFLPRLVGIAQASEWIMSGRVFSAQEALDGGLVSRVVSPEELIPTAKELAREIILNNSAVSVALSRQMLWRLQGADHPMEAHIIESQALYYMMRSKDFQEGVKSFLEKRLPEFSMKPSEDMPDFFPWWDEKPFKIE